MILSNMNCSYVPVKEDWRLSERHYGNLTGERKREVANTYGEEQVMQWRRAYDVAPPPIEETNRYYYTIVSNPIFDEVPAGHFPHTESMHMCVDRVAPMWQEVRQELFKGSKVLMVVHGTVARALVQLIEGETLSLLPNRRKINLYFNLESPQASPTMPLKRSTSPIVCPAFTSSILPRAS